MHGEFLKDFQISIKFFHAYYLQQEKDEGVDLDATIATNKKYKVPKCTAQRIKR